MATEDVQLVGTGPPARRQQTESWREKQRRADPRPDLIRPPAQRPTEARPDFPSPSVRPSAPPAAKMPRNILPPSKPESQRRSLRVKRYSDQPAPPAKKAPVKKAATKAKKPKVTKGKASDTTQEPGTAPAQNGENKEA